MKIIIQIAFLIVSSIAVGQEWRDSLDVARNAYENKDYSKALKYYESAQKKAPENIDLSDEMGQSAYKAREFEKAEKIYQQNGGNKKSNKAKSENYHNVGNSRMKSKNFQGAVDAYKESLRMNPNDEQTRYNLSEAIRQLKNEEKKKQNQDKKENQQDKKNQQDNQDKQEQQSQDNQEGEQDQQSQGSQENTDQEGEGQQQGQLPNKTVEKMLDELMKQEAETKRRMSGNQGGGKTPKSGKDW